MDDVNDDLPIFPTCTYILYSIIYIYIMFLHLAAIFWDFGTQKHFTIAKPHPLVMQSTNPRPQAVQSWIVSVVLWHLPWMKILVASLWKYLLRKYGSIWITIWVHLVMTNIAMENPNHKWRFIAGKIIYKWAIYTMAMLVITRRYIYIYISIKNGGFP